MTLYLNVLQRSQGLLENPTHFVSALDKEYGRLQNRYQKLKSKLKDFEKSFSDLDARIFIESTKLLGPIESADMMRQEVLMFGDARRVSLKDANSKIEEILSEIRRLEDLYPDLVAKSIKRNVEIRCKIVSGEERLKHLSEQIPKLVRSYRSIHKRYKVYKETTKEYRRQRIKECQHAEKEEYDQETSKKVTFHKDC